MARACPWRFSSAIDWVLTPYLSGEHSACIDKKHLCIIDSDNTQHVFSLDCCTIAFKEAHPIDLDRAARNHQIGSAVLAAVAGNMRVSA
jgi:hypothetical protein